MAVSSSRDYSLKEAVFNHSKLIHSYVSVEHLAAELTNTKLEFMSPVELAKLYEIPGEQKKARHLLVCLKQQNVKSIRKFVACLVLERDHVGHQDICQAIMKDLPKSEKIQVLKLVKQVAHDYEESVMQICGMCVDEQDLCSLIETDGAVESDGECDCSAILLTCPTPSRSPPFIVLTGRLAGEQFQRVDKKLWDLFSTGQYEHLEILTGRLEGRNSIDFKIIGMWFKSLIMMHRDAKYQDCLMNILFPALDLCNDEKTENPSILKGRILQRIAQVFLVNGNKAEAAKHFEWAEQELQFVGKCYETVNMHCRRAKILSTTCDGLEDREKTETEFSVALSTFTDDDAFAPASKPSLILAKAAFHLHISFGSRPSLNQLEPALQPCDIEKAEATLSGLSNGMIHLDMRKSEEKLISAELQRLKGNQQLALALFDTVIKETTQKNFINLKAIAENRVHNILDKRSEIEELLEGLP